MKKALLFTLTLQSNQNYDIGLFSCVKSNNLGIGVYLNYQTKLKEINSQLALRLDARDFVFEFSFSTNKTLNLKLEIEIIKNLIFYIQIKFFNKNKINIGIGAGYSYDLNEDIIVGLLFELNHYLNLNNEYEDDDKVEEKIQSNIENNNNYENTLKNSNIQQNQYFNKNNINNIENINSSKFNDLVKHENNIEEKRKNFYLLFNVFFDEIKELVQKNVKNNVKIEKIYTEILEIFHIFTTKISPCLSKIKKYQKINKNLYNLISNLPFSQNEKINRNKTTWLINHYDSLCDFNIIEQEDVNFNIDKILDAMNNKIGMYHLNYYNDFSKNNFFFSFPNIESSDNFGSNIDFKKTHIIDSFEEYNDKNSVFASETYQTEKTTKYQKIDQHFNCNVIIKKALFYFLPDIQIVQLYSNICHAMVVVENKDEAHLLDTNGLSSQYVFPDITNEKNIKVLTGSNCVVHSLFLAILIKAYNNEQNALKALLNLHIMFNEENEKKSEKAKKIINQFFSKKNVEEKNNLVKIQKNCLNSIKNNKSFSNFLREELNKQNLVIFKKNYFDRLKKRLKTILEKDKKYLNYALIDLLNKNSLNENENKKEDKNKKIFKIFNLIKNFEENSNAINEIDLDDDIVINMLLSLETIFINENQKKIKEIFNKYLKNIIHLIQDETINEFLKTLNINEK